mmetsp:Transcript_1934/g.6928  ORF Transcript_1934/g.6928 Transcript_1934/m.6928 type:complete len:284 (-) Transcript_1934:816-1667(-)
MDRNSRILLYHKDMKSKVGPRVVRQLPEKSSLGNKCYNSRQCSPTNNCTNSQIGKYHGHYTLYSSWTTLRDNSKTHNWNPQNLNCTRKYQQHCKRLVLHKPQVNQNQCQSIGVLMRRCCHRSQACRNIGPIQCNSNLLSHSMNNCMTSMYWYCGLKKSLVCMNRKPHQRNGSCSCKNSVIRKCRGHGKPEANRRRFQSIGVLMSRCCRCTLFCRSIDVNQYSSNSSTQELNNYKQNNLMRMRKNPLRMCHIQDRMIQRILGDMWCNLSLSSVLLTSSQNKVFH